MRRLLPVLISLGLAALLVAACGAASVNTEIAPSDAESEGGQPKLVYFYADW